MFCYQCGNQIKREFSKFCDHCGSNLEIKPKTFFVKKEVAINMEDEMGRATDLFILWNFNIAASLIFYIFYTKTDDYSYLFMFTIFMLILSWMLLLIKLHDLSILKRSSSKNFMIANFGIPIFGTFYYFLKINQEK